jgi:hypothetical protein
MQKLIMTAINALRCFFITILFLLLLSVVNAQLFKPDSIRIAQKSPLFLPYPVVGYAPETKLQLGFGAVYSFYMDKSSPITRTSFLYSYNMFSTEGQIQLILQGSFWTKENKWHMFTSGIYSDFPLYFYGVGAHTHEADKDQIIANQFRLVMGGERKIAKALYVGGGFGFQSDHFTDPEKGGIFDTGNYVGKEGGKLALIGYEAVYDTRDYENYSTKGSYLRVIGWTNFAYSDWHYTVITIDGRHFIPINKIQSLGMQAVFQTTHGADIPFYALSRLGGSSYLRGYYSLRYNDQNLLIAQAEYKWQPWGNTRDRGFVSASRIIVAAFAGTGTVFPNGGFNFKDFFPSYGGGIRYMFDPLARLTLRIDVAIGNKQPNEDRSTGFYISFNEAF